MSQGLSAHHGNYYKDAYTAEEKEAFILSYIPRVEAIAKNLQVPDELFEDFVSAGILGVTKALSKNHLTDRYLSVTINQHVISEMVDCFVSYSNIPNVGDFIAAAQDIKAFYTKSSLDETLAAPNHLNPLFQISNCDDPEETVINKVTAEELKQIIVDLLNEERLDFREAAILIYHLGLFGKPSLAFSKIIRLLDLHITPERARQIYRKACLKIKRRASIVNFKITHSPDLMVLKKILEVKKNV